LAVFLRKRAGDPQAIQQALEQQFQQCRLRDVPDRVLAKRLEAARDRSGSHFGRHLTLLWDDPRRLPPTITYEELT
jgi:hypothetical protein